MNAWPVSMQVPTKDLLYYLLFMGLTVLIVLVRLGSISSPASSTQLFGLTAKNNGRISGTQASVTATLGSTQLKMRTGNMA